MKRRVFKFALSAALGAVLLSCATSLHAQEITRIKFAKGKSAATVRGAVLRDEMITYLVSASKGQRMKVVITSVERNASFWIQSAPDEFLPGAGEEDDQTTWSGVLPVSGDYKIVVAPTRGNATYRMTVSVK